MDEQILEQQEEQVIEEPHGEQEPQTDWKAEARKWEARAKANSKAADELEQLKTSNQNSQSEFEAATKRAEELEAELTQLKAATAKQNTINAVAEEIGVNANLLARMVGDSEEEIRNNAQLLQAAVPIYPTTRDGGSATPSTITKESILAIENERERLKAIQENIELF